MRGLAILWYSYTITVMKNIDDKKTLMREILLSFWKVHILHHAKEGGVVGQWMLRELHEHGYYVSPGTLYPLLKRMEGNGWLSGESDGCGARPRRKYYITEKGEDVLEELKFHVSELSSEVFGGKDVNKSEK